MESTPLLSALKSTFSPTTKRKEKGNGTSTSIATGTSPPRPRPRHRPRSHMLSRDFPDLLPDTFSKEGKSLRWDEDSLELLANEKATSRSKPISPSKFNTSKASIVMTSMTEETKRELSATPLPPPPPPPAATRNTSSTFPKSALRNANKSSASHDRLNRNDEHADDNSIQINTDRIIDYGGPKSRGWQILRAHLAQGDFLLRLKNTGQGRGSMISGTVRSQRSPAMSTRGMDGHSATITSQTPKTKSMHRRQIFQEIQSGTSLSLQHGFLAIGTYLTISIIVFSCVLEPQWSMIDSAYFAVSTFTTLGYGDLTPTNAWSKIFTCIYGLLGVACLGLALGQMGNRLLSDEEEAFHRAQRMCKHDAMTLFSHRGSIPGTSTGTTTNATGSGIRHILDDYQDYHHHLHHHHHYYEDQDANLLISSNKSAPATGGLGNFKGGASLSGAAKWEAQERYKRKWRIRRIIFLIVSMIGLACTVGYMSGWAILDTFYYLIITGCTIGYGDFFPTTETERLIGIFFIPIAVLVMGHGLGYIANSLIEIHSSRFLERYESRELSQEDLDAMDVNGDGVVTRAEFLEFMLVAMNKIDWDLVNELQEYFNRLDAAGTGELSRDDLVAAARRKLKHPRRKLALAAYKQRLLGQAEAAAAKAAQLKQERTNLLSRLSWLPAVHFSDTENPSLRDRASFTLGSSRRLPKRPMPRKSQPSSWDTVVCKVELLLNACEQGSISLNEWDDRIDDDNDNNSRSIYDDNDDDDSMDPF